MSAKSCSWCGHDEAAADRGFLLDTGQPGYGRWVPGPLETGGLGNANVSGKDQYAVLAFRCSRCSHLELFAPGEETSGSAQG